MASRVLQHVPQEDQTANRTLTFLQELLREYHPRNFAIEFWDGTCWDPEPGQFRRFGWKIHRAATVRQVFSAFSQLVFAEAFICGDFDLEGDIEGAFPLVDYLLHKAFSIRQKERLDQLLATLPGTSGLHPVRRGPRLPGRIHSRERARAAAEYHYGLSNDFYSLWLDKDMQYSCAYFHSANDSLEVAQRQKLDYICRKLRLQAGERLLDIGCGWGGLIVQAAQNYGVNAVGIALSEQERQLADQKIQQTGLGGRCQVKLLDYRDLSEPEAYDKIISVEMLQHIGEENLADYFKQVNRGLRPDGVFLAQFITAPQAAEQASFDRVYVLPNTELLPLSTVERAFEAAGLQLGDLENLSHHYAPTLRHWLRGVESHAEQSRRLLDEVTYRTWKLHIAERAHNFFSGRMGVFQAVLTKDRLGRSKMPLTRADWYAKREVVKQPDPEPDPNEWTP